MIIPCPSTRALCEAGLRDLSMLIVVGLLSGCGVVDSGGSQEPPPVDAGDPRIVNEQATVRLDASGLVSTGEIESFQWRQTGGAIAVRLNNADTPVATFVVPEVNQREVLEFTLKTTDEFGAVNDDEVQITINDGPTANAGTDRTVTAGLSASLNGAGSTDSDGEIRYAWQQIAGTEVMLDRTTTARPTFIVPAGEPGASVRFRLVVTDNNGARSVDTVTIAINLSPEAKAGRNQTVTENQPVTLDGTGSTDPEKSALRFQWTQTAGTPVTLTGANTATPTFIAPNVIVVPLSLTFQLNVTDPVGAAGTDIVTITVERLNRPPVAVNDGPFTVAEGGTLIVPGRGVLANDIDPDRDPIVAQLVSGPAHAETFNLNTNGSFTYVHGGSEIARDSFTYRASDGILTSNVATASITVTQVNDPPIANPDSATTEEGTAILINLVANDIDPDPAGGINPGSVQVTQPANGTVINNLDGTVTYTPNPGFSGTNTFVYTVADIAGARSAGARVAVTVTAANDLPIATTDFATISAINAPTIINVTANDTDPDGAEDLDLASIAIVTPPSFGSAQPNADGTVTYTQMIPDAFGAPQADSFSYTIGDVAGARSNVITVTISAGVAPTSANACWTSPAGATLMAKLKPDRAGLQTPLSYAFTSLGAKGRAIMIDARTGMFTYMPAGVGAQGSDVLTYQVRDARGRFRTREVTVIIDPKLMTVGDGITAGIVDGAKQWPPPETRVGYRKPLQQKLKAAGYAMDFVGSQAFGAGVPGFDYESEARAGYSAQELANGSPTRDLDYPNSGIYAWLESHPADFVLLHLSPRNLRTADASAVALILDEIDRFERDHQRPVRVLLARVIDRKPQDPRITAYNNEVAGMVRARVKDPASPDLVVMVDQHGALTYPADLHDRLYPTPGGYTKMAKRWFEAIHDTCRSPK